MRMSFYAGNSRTSREGGEWGEREREIEGGKWEIKGEKIRENEKKEKNRRKVEDTQGEREETENVYRGLKASK